MESNVLSAALLEGKALTPQQARDVEFVRTLTNTIADEVCNNIAAGRIPEHWDGHELRQLLADKFARAVGMSHDMRNKRSRRRKAYENVVIINNL